MTSNEDWKKRFEDAKSMLADKSGEYDRLQAKFSQLEHNASMRNIDDKFEPLYLRPDISDEDYSRADYPFLGRSPHNRNSSHASRRIKAQQTKAQQLSETGYHSELSESLDQSDNSLRNPKRSSRPRSKENKAIVQKVDMLKTLKNKANNLYNQIENQRDELSRNMRDYSNAPLNAEDELSLVDSEIAAQKEMLKEADKTLNQILSKMETEVEELDPDQLDNHSSPEIRELKEFLKEQSNNAKRRLDAAQEESQGLTNQNRELSTKFKQYKKDSENEINRLKRSNLRLQRIQANKNHKMDTKTEEALAEEQLRLALEERMKEMWQPAEVLNRIATFVDSNFEKIGNDELSSALGHIKSRSDELKHQSAQRMKADLTAKLPKKTVPQDDKLENQLRHDLNRKEMELRQVSQSQKRALDDIATLKAQLNTVKTELKNTSVTLSEKDGCTLTLEKDIKRLKANLKLSQNENDQCQKSLHRSISDMNKLQSVQFDGSQQSQQLQRSLSVAERKLEDQNMVIDQLKQEIQIAESNEKSRVKDIANLTSENKSLGDVQRKAKRDNVLLNDDLQNYKTKLSDLRKLVKDQDTEAKELQDLKDLVGDIRKSQESKVNDQKTKTHFDDRFDEILDALRRMEKRLHSGSRSKTEQIINAIIDLNDLLNSYNLPVEFENLQNHLSNFRKFIDQEQADPEDEFYFVPSGYRPTEKDMQHKSSGINFPTKSHKVKSEKKEKFRGYVPVYHPSEPVHQMAPTVKVKVKKRPRRPEYDLIITSKPEELAIKHSNNVLKTLRIMY